MAIRPRNRILEMLGAGLQRLLQRLPEKSTGAGWGGQPNSVPLAESQGRETHFPAQSYRVALVVEADRVAIRPTHPSVAMSKRWPSVAYCCRVSIDSDAAQLRLKTHYQAYD